MSSKGTSRPDHGSTNSAHTEPTETCHTSLVARVVVRVVVRVVEQDFEMLCTGCFF